MSSFKEPRPLTAEEETEQNEILYEQRFEHLMEEFFFTGDVQVLKSFINLGGDIDQYGLRETIADLISVGSAPNPGGAKDAINIAFYMAVESRMMRWVKKSKSNEDGPKDPTLQEQLLSLTKVGKTQAIAEIATEWSEKGRGISYEGGRTRYKTGKKLFIEKYDRVWN